MARLTLTFLEHCKPELPVGDTVYTLRVRQDVAGGSTAPASSGQPQTLPDRFEQTLKFRLAAPSRALAPGDVQAMYPPAGACGAFEDVVPHVTLTNPALPWLHDQPVGAGTSPQPWLGLLLAIGDEIDGIRQDNGANGGGLADGTAPAPGGGACRTITIPATLSGVIVPDRASFSVLAHVQETSQGTRSCLLASRAAEPGQMHNVYLVSLHDLKEPGEEQTLRVLHSWRFTAEDEKANATRKTIDFERMFSADVLDTRPLRMVWQTPSAEETWQLAQAACLDAGYVPLEHHKASGAQDVAWYRGPLCSAEPGDHVADTRRPRVSPKELTGVEDISLFAATELGRLLALSDMAFMRDLTSWISGCRRATVSRDEHAALAGLPARPPRLDRPFPEAFLAGMAGLETVPFRYLVPDPRMLPPNSLRYFRLDTRWIRTLVEGAVSAAMATRPSRDASDTISSTIDSLLRVFAGDRGAQGRGAFGVLLRSDAVTAWPDMEVRFLSPKEFIDPTSDEVREDFGTPAWRTLRPAPGVLMAILKDEVCNGVGFRLPADRAHFSTGGSDDWRGIVAGSTNSADLAAQYVDLGHSAWFGLNPVPVTRGDDDPDIYDNRLS